jgi:cytochrome P450
MQKLIAAVPENRKSQTVIDLALRHDDVSKEALSGLVRQLKTFLFAGHDTSAAAISWVYYYLSFHPQVLAKLRAEHDAIFGPFTNSESLADKLRSEPKLLAKLDYTLAVIRESLRLQPVADGAREGPRGYIIRTASGLEFDAGEMMISPQHKGLHTDEGVWGPSAHEFDPDRFMSGKIPTGYMPFSTRPRDCIGRNLVYIEVRSVNGDFSDYT